MTKQDLKPPLFAVRFLTWLIAPHLLESILGDMQETFDQNAKRLGKRKAQWMYWSEMPGYIKPEFIRRKQNTYQSSPIISHYMIRNYFKIAIRNFRNNKAYTLINVIGLTLGLACCVLVFFTVRYELSFDAHHKDIGQVYRLLRYTKERGDKGLATGIPLPVLDALKNDFPALKNQIACTYALKGTLVTVEQEGNKKKFDEDYYAIAFVGPEYFRLLNYEWIKGSPEASLTNPGSVVLSEKQAERYFGKADPMGKTIRINNQKDFVVSGLIADPPATTNFPFTTLISFSSLKDYGAYTNWDDWASSYGGGQMYVKLPQSMNQADFEKQLTGFNKKYYDAKAAAETSFILQAVNDIHFDNRTSNYAGRTISKGMIWTMVLVGSFILIAACVNFVNLATAQAIRRSREVGVRKVLGSTRFQLLRQYFSETAFITVLSVLLALIASQLALPYVASVLNIPAQGVMFISDPVVLAFMFALVVITTILAGFYPAMVLSGFQPILALKGKVKTGGSGQAHLRRSLIVLQFTISQVVLIGTVIAYNQMQYFQTMDLGFEKDEIVNITIPESDFAKMESLKSRLASETGIRSMSQSQFTPMSQSNWQTGFKYENDTEFLNFEIVMRPADTAYVHTYGMEMAAGRMYLPSDSIREYVVNEAFVKAMGMKRPQEIIGKRMAIGGSDYKFPIVGVIKNFNTYSLHREIIPCVMTTLKGNYSKMGIKLSAHSDKNLLSRIEKVWSSVYPDYLFKYTFYDETLNSYYSKEEKLFSLFRILAGIAVFIGCLGLYGVVAFMVESRTKEMGIRKAIGATAFNIFGLFSIDFVKLVVIALVIASPVAWYGMSQWLQDFTYRISISWWMFAVTGIVVIFIALITISFQSVKAALMNPVKALRSE
ncbi:ABC transporter permease [Dyadobacter luteus]|nr:ABC transporter permease [Dyadobacter luteus]